MLPGPTDRFREILPTRPIVRTALRDEQRPRQLRPITVARSYAFQSHRAGNTVLPRSAREKAQGHCCDSFHDAVSLAHQPDPAMPSKDWPLPDTLLEILAEVE